MAQRHALTRSGRISDPPSTDKAHRAPTSPLDVSDDWKGDQVNQAAWFNRVITDAEKSFEFKTLVQTAAVSLPSKGTMAVFSPDHAREHLAMRNLGSFRKPNLRMREDLSNARTNATAPAAASPAGSHGGYPSPTPPAITTSVHTLRPIPCI